MTTKFTVDTHAGWPVEVVRVDPTTTEAQDSVYVKSYSTYTGHIHSGRTVILREVQPDEVLPGAGPIWVTDPLPLTGE